MRRNLEDLCSKPWAKCVAYADLPGFNQTWHEESWATVAVDEYLKNSTMKTVGDCCGNPTESNPTASRFFCDPHRSLTFHHQYRFLPALNHARRAFAAQWQSASLRWLVLLDDDSVVHADRLEAILSSHQHDQPLYMGDFGPWTNVYANVPKNRRGLYSWKTPYACGGSGSVLSRAAILKTNFDACEHKYHAGCYQSDFMIGHCLAKAGVIPMVDHMSCGVCLPCKIPEAKSVKLAMKLASQVAKQKQCGFALFSPCSAQQETAKSAMIKENICNAALDQAAITHGAQRACNRSDALWANGKLKVPHVTNKTITDMLTEIGETPFGPLASYWKRGGRPWRRGDAAVEKTAGGGGDVATSHYEESTTSHYLSAVASLPSSPQTAQAAPVLSGTPAAQPADKTRPLRADLRAAASSENLVRFLGQLDLKRFRKKLVLLTGVNSIRDTPFLTAADLEEVGMNPHQQAKVLEAASAVSTAGVEVDPENAKEGEGPVAAVIRQLGLIRVAGRFVDKGQGKLGVRNLPELMALTDDQLKTINFKAVTRRRFLYAMSRLTTKLKQKAKVRGVSRRF